MRDTPLPSTLNDSVTEVGSRGTAAVVEREYGVCSSPSATNRTRRLAGGVVGACCGCMPESTGDVKYMSNMERKRTVWTTVAAMARLRVETITAEKGASFIRVRLHIAGLQLSCGNQMTLVTQVYIICTPSLQS